MRSEDLIPVNDFCIYHNVQYTFIEHLQDAGLIEVNVVNQITCIPIDQIQKLERLARLHTQLQINEPGIAVIDDMLQKMEKMQREMDYLRNRLRLYEE